MNEYKAVLVEITEGCRQHSVCLSEIEYAVSSNLPHATPGEVRKTTLALLRDLIVVQRMVTGGYSRVADRYIFKPWGLAPKCALDRIYYEWSALDRELNFGDIVWFSSRDRLG